MSLEESFPGLMRQLERGDPRACAEVFEKFAPDLVRIARARMSPRLRIKEDPDDLVQSAFKSFFAQYAEGKCDYENWDALWGMLVLITVRKCTNRVDKLYAAKRDVRREVRSDDSNAPGVFEGVGNDPSPSSAALLQETLERLMSELSERDQQILSLRLQNYSVAEISAQVQRTTRTVERVLQQVRSRLLAWQSAD